MADIAGMTTDLRTRAIRCWLFGTSTDCLLVGGGTVATVGKRLGPDAGGSEARTFGR